MTSPSRRGLMLGAGAAAVSATLPLAEAQASPSRPNLILFFPDEMRADTVGSYGNPVCQTPNFDRLAKDGARFENCHVQYPVCGASRCSLLTGWPTSVRGHRSLYYFLRPDEPNMFRYLRQAGYDVFWLGKNDALAPGSFADSVTQWSDAPMGLPPGVKSLAPPGVTTMLYSSGGDRRATSDYALLQKAFAILERKEVDRPACIFLAMSEPHPPYTAPDSFGTMYKPASLPPLIPPGLAKKPNFHAAIRRKFGLDKASDADSRQVRATYYGQVSYTDWLLGELLETLEKTGRTKDTALFVGSDHGDYAGDYGLIEKWPSGMESCLTHVPLIGRVPGGTPGVVARDMVELYDLMATFLELGGTRATHTHFARSLLPQMHGGPGDPNRAAFTEGGYNDYEPQAFEPKLGGLYAPKTELQNDEPETIRRCASIKTSRYTYVARPGGQGELYDRKADPGETRNLIDERGSQPVVDQMQQRLLNWYINTSGVPEPTKDARGLPPYYQTEPKRTTPEDLARILDQ